VLAGGCAVQVAVTSGLGAGHAVPWPGVVNVSVAEGTGGRDRDDSLATCSARMGPKAIAALYPTNKTIARPTPRTRREITSRDAT